METEIGAMQLQTEDGQLPPAVGRGKEQILNLSFLRKHSFADTLVSAQ